MRTRTRAAAVAVVVAIGAIGATTALAVTPKPGSHFQGTPVQGGTLVVISMDVDDDGSIVAVGANDPECPTDDGLYKGFKISKKIKVKDSGKFKFDGVTTQNIVTPNPPKVKVVLKGKFTSSKRASGTYTIEGCPGKVSWETKYIG